jgi:hypothetical protein
MSKYTEFLNFIKEDFNNDSKLKPVHFKNALDKIAKNLHEKIDKAAEELEKNGIEAFEKEEKEKGTTEVIALPEDNPKLDVKMKIHNLVSSLDQMLKRTEYLDEAIRQIQEDPLKKLLNVNKNNELLFNLTRKFELKIKGKVSADLGWKTVQNKNYSNIDSNDSSNLKIYGTSCYNYYQTDKEFADEDVEVVFLTNGYQVSDYFYFGVRNEATDVNSSCMCCSPSTVTYFKSNGQVFEQGSSRTESKLCHNNSAAKEIRIRIKLVLSDPLNKKVFFEVNDNGECGPYKLQGSKFTVVSGSCNTCNGYIKIESALYN